MIKFLVIAIILAFSYILIYALMKASSKETPSMYPLQEKGSEDG